jgi:hypothetical protein
MALPNVTTAQAGAAYFPRASPGGGRSTTVRPTPVDSSWSLGELDDTAVAYPVRSRHAKRFFTAGFFETPLDARSKTSARLRAPACSSHPAEMLP